MGSVLEASQLLPRFPQKWVVRFIRQQRWGRKLRWEECHSEKGAQYVPNHRGLQQRRAAWPCKWLRICARRHGLEIGNEQAQEEGRQA